MSTTEAATETAPGLRVVQDATCTVCGCVCDDMELTVEGDRITKAKNACVLGKAWFFNHHVEERPEALIDGQPAGYDQAMERAAELLLSARFPLTCATLWPCSREPFCEPALRPRLPGTLRSSCVT